MTSITDAGHFFQTDSALANSDRKAAKARNNAGNPIRLASKLLAILVDPYSTISGAIEPAVYVAEAAGTVKRVVLSSGKTSLSLRPNTTDLTPLTCLAFQPDTARGPNVIWAGSWDKAIYGWEVSGTLPRTTSSRKLVGHSDFVKCLEVMSNGLLASGGSDGNIIIWDTQNSDAKLHVISAHTRPVQAFAAHPSQELILFSGDSKQEIRAWSIARTGYHEVQPASVAENEAEDVSPFIEPLVVHETSINALEFRPDGDLITASADKSAKTLSHVHGFQVDSTFTHPDAVSSLVCSDILGLAITGCRDENVRVWDIGSGKCIATLGGHWDEVTGLALVEQRPERRLYHPSQSPLVSVSLDGTIRQWPLDPKFLAKAEAAYDEEIQKQRTQPNNSHRVEKNPIIEMTEEELAELMADD